MSIPRLEIKLAAFSFPNYLRNKFFPDDLISVGRMTDRQAGAYWDSLRKEWLRHVRKRRELDAVESKYGEKGV